LAPPGSPVSSLSPPSPRRNLPPEISGELPCSGPARQGAAAALQSRCLHLGFPTSPPYPRTPNPSRQSRCRRRCRGSPPRRLLAAFRRRSGTVGLPRWGKDTPPPLLSLDLASPRPHALAGVPEPRAAVARPLRPPPPPPFAPIEFPVSASLSPTGSRRASPAESLRSVSSGEPPPPPPRLAPPHRRSRPEPPSAVRSEHTVWIRSRPVRDPGR
jgi:hypothetical protein